MVRGDGRDHLVGRAGEEVLLHRLVDEGLERAVGPGLPLRRGDRLLVEIGIERRRGDHRDDLAGLDNEELVELLGQHGLSDDGESGDIIMAARAHWFTDETADSTDTDDASASSDS